MTGPHQGSAYEPLCPHCFPDHLYKGPSFESKHPSHTYHIGCRSVLATAVSYAGIQAAEGQSLETWVLFQF